MKTNHIILIGIIIAIAVTITSISITYNQEIKLATGIMTSDEKPQPATLPESEITSRYEKYLDENNELNFALRYDKNGMIIDDLQRIFDWCDYSGEKPTHWYFDWNNQTHHIDTNNCKWIIDEDIEPTWISLPVTSCGYPWHESNHEKTRQYFVEYRNIFGNYDSSDPTESKEAMHYVITRYYEDLGKDILEVKTSYDSSTAGIGEGCNTTVGGTWHLKIHDTDLSYFLNNGFVEQK